MSDIKTVSKAQQKATAKYKKNNYDRMEILLTKGRKTKIQIHAALTDLSTVPLMKLWREIRG
jgi:hypothetical protein